jgi:tryptophan synthase beta subunit
MVVVGADFRPCHLAAHRCTDPVGGCSAAVGQFVGFLFTALALVSFALGVDVAGRGLTALTFGVSALNACTGVCLGCKVYLLVRGSRPA